jgi:hypothetical protein
MDYFNQREEQGVWNREGMLPTWRSMNRDTAPEIEDMLLAFWRETPIWRKFQLVAQMNWSARQLALAGLRRRHPSASSQELQHRLAGLILGSELATRVYGPLPNPLADNINE